MKCIRVSRCRSVGRHPLDSLKENTGFLITVLVSVQNIAPSLEYPNCDARHQAGLIRPM
jgi:hypothetical protein